MEGTKGQAAQKLTRKQARQQDGKQGNLGTRSKFPAGQTGSRSAEASSEVDQQRQKGIKNKKQQDESEHKRGETGTNKDKERSVASGEIDADTLKQRAADQPQNGAKEQVRPSSRPQKANLGQNGAQKNEGQHPNAGQIKQQKEAAGTGQAAQAGQAGNTVQKEQVL